MKASVTTAIAAMSAYRSNRCILLLFALLLLGGRPLGAQTIPVGERVQSGERVEYELYFKWGLLMPRAGYATLAIRDTSYVGQPGIHYRLLFRTVGIFERIYSMRDTIDCRFTPDFLLIHSEKRSDEGDYYSVDALTFHYTDEAITTHSLRYTPSRVKIDTTLCATEQRMYDMLGATLYLRSLDWNEMQSGDSFPFNVAIGRDVVNISFRYTGQQIVERGHVKYRTRHFYIDIYDEAFTQSKEAAEIWIGDDANHLPVKIRAKLKIGAAEVYYHASEGLRHPLDCRVEIRR